MRAYVLPLLVGLLPSLANVAALCGDETPAERVGYGNVLDVPPVARIKAGMVQGRVSSTLGKAGRRISHNPATGREWVVYPASGVVVLYEWERLLHASAVDGYKPGTRSPLDWSGNEEDKYAIQREIALIEHRMVNRR